MLISFQNLLAILTICVYPAHCTVGDDDGETQIILEVEHSFNYGPDFKYKPRGVINVKSIRSGIAAFSNEIPLDEEDIQNLKNLVSEDGFYTIQASYKKSGGTPHTVSSFIKACSLYESKLSDILTLNLDQSGALLGISVTTMQSRCQGIKVRDDELNNFNTTLMVVTTEPGPSPDTQAFIQKLDRENEAKAKGEQADNRSFFAKYWMYIVPVLIFLAISGATPDQGAART